MTLVWFYNYMCILLLLVWISWLLFGSVVDSSSNSNEYKEYFLGVKAADA
jgi:hypothetical protein